MRYFFYLLITSCVLLSGCATTSQQPNIVVNDTVVIYRPLPPGLLEKCNIPEPMPEKDQSVLTVEEKSNYYTGLIYDLYIAIGDCADKISSINLLYSEDNK